MVGWGWGLSYLPLGYDTHGIHIHNDVPWSVTLMTLKVGWVSGTVTQVSQLMVVTEKHRSQEIRY